MSRDAPRCPGSWYTRRWGRAEREEVIKVVEKILLQDNICQVLDNVGAGLVLDRVKYWLYVSPSHAIHPQVADISKIAKTFIVPFNGCWLIDKFLRLNINKREKVSYQYKQVAALAH